MRFRWDTGVGGDIELLHADDIFAGRVVRSLKPRPRVHSFLVYDSAYKLVVTCNGASEDECRRRARRVLEAVVIAEGASGQ